MSDNYRAVYDAVQESLLNMGIGHYVSSAMEEIRVAAVQNMRPSVLFKPSLSLDGNQWCALYGSDLMDGVAGFGDTPALAMEAFDEAFIHAKPPSMLAERAKVKP